MGGAPVNGRAYMNRGEAYMELAIAGTGLGIIGLLVVIVLVILVLRIL
jgi:hypothetical protein